MYDDSYWKRGLGRNRRVMAFVRFLMKGYLRRRFGIGRNEYIPHEEPFLLLGNHVSDWDPFIEALIIPRYMRFVATEHLIKSRPLGPIIRFLINPIPRRKAASADDTVEYIRRNLGLGINVAMFPEGVRTLNGRTGYVSPRTGELVKSASGSLITCRLSGGYLCDPVWASEKRKGEARCEIVAEYSREQLDKMTVDEINEVINRDLFVDVFEDQRGLHCRYSCDSPAAGLENALYICPECCGIGTMRGTGNTFSCRCGYSVRINDYGFFEGEPAVFDNIADWDVWQRDYVASHRSEWLVSPGHVLCCQSGITLSEAGGKKANVLLSGADMQLYPDRIVFESASESKCFELSAITRMSNHRSISLLFSAGEKYYEASSDSEWPVYRYVEMYRLLTGKPCK